MQQAIFFLSSHQSARWCRKCLSPHEFRLISKIKGIYEHVWWNWTASFLHRPKLNSSEISCGNGASMFNCITQAIVVCAFFARYLYRRQMKIAQICKPNNANLCNGDEQKSGNINWILWLCQRNSIHKICLCVRRFPVYELISMVVACDQKSSYEMV